MIFEWIFALSAISFVNQEYEGRGERRQPFVIFPLRKYFAFEKCRWVLGSITLKVQGCLKCLISRVKKQPRCCSDIFYSRLDLPALHSDGILIGKKKMLPLKREMFFQLNEAW